MIQPFSALCPAPFGILGIRVSHHAVSEISILDSAEQPFAPDPLGLEAARQLRDYFQDATQVFDLPLRLAGTPFQQRVWQALQEIPMGQVLTYGQLATRLGSGPRAVGGACRANPVAILVPCHRVVGVKGLTGYMGRDGLAYKRWLLAHEGADYATL